MTEFKTGDMILYEGNGIVSKFITMLPGAKFSHVSFYYLHPVFGPCVLESTSIGTDNDLITGEPMSGVQLTAFDERIKNYDGLCYHRPLIDPLTDEQDTMFCKLFKQWHGTPYEDNNWQLMKAELDGPDWLDFEWPWLRNEQDESSVFCSEYVKLTVRGIGLVKDDGTPSNEDTPTDSSVKWPDAYRAVESDAIVIGQ